ncbi:MAG: hypothetical protein ACI4JK_05065 [Oscillospiraceae bacterium]
MDVVQMKCPNCGGSVVFDPKKQMHICEYCQSEFTSDELKRDAAEVDDLNTPSSEEQAEFNEHTNLYICDNCGAEIIADENTAATFCYYCHSPVSLKGRLTGECRPEMIIPFSQTREQAMLNYKEWCKKKWFLPNDYTSFSTLEKITGLYVPFWLADCKVDAVLDADARIITTYVSGDYNVTRTKYFKINRAAKIRYDGVPADGSKKIEDSLMSAIEPFDYTKFKQFDMSYLSGFFADKYDVSKDEVLPNIKARISQSAERVLMDSIIGYTSVIPQFKNVRLVRTNWHYVMLPVWFLNYKYKGKDYEFAMNGQTGKIEGYLPISKAKLAALAVGLFVVFGTIAGFIAGGILG